MTSQTEIRFARYLTLTAIIGMIALVVLTTILISKSLSCNTSQSGATGTAGQPVPVELPVQ